MTRENKNTRKQNVNICLIFGPSQLFIICKSMLLIEGSFL